MAIVRNWEYTSLAELDDPDDYRPNSELAMVIHPGRLSPYVRKLLEGDPEEAIRPLSEDEFR